MTGRGYFVTGTDTDIGKTLVAAAMLRGLGATGLRVAAMKPVSAGAEWRDGQWHNDDCDALAAAANVVVPAQMATPYLFEQPTAPHIAATREGRDIDLDVILRCYGDVAALADAVVVEGVGGFRVPLGVGFDSADLAVRFNLPMVLVVGLRLGCINHALLTAEAIAARELALVGWVANTIDADMANADANVEAIAERLNAPLLGRIPRLSHENSAARAEAALTHLDLSRLPPLALRRTSQ